MKAVLVISMALTLSACAARTQQVAKPQQQKSAPFQTGRTTYAEVLAALGEPSEAIRHPDGSRAISYFYSKSQAKADSGIPHFGDFRDGTEVVSSFVSMRFNKAGILIHYSAVSGKTMTGTSLLSEVQP